jgi:hypothetical protein
MQRGCDDFPRECVMQPMNAGDCVRMCRYFFQTRDFLTIVGHSCLFSAAG